MGKRTNQIINEIKLSWKMLNQIAFIIILFNPHQQTSFIRKKMSHSVFISL